MSRTFRSRGVRWLPFAVICSVSLFVAPPVWAAPVPFDDTPLNGWDVNGTVYAVEIVGDTVYVGGSFTQARSPGSSSVADRTSLAAFDLTTGALVTTFTADVTTMVGNPGVVRSLVSDGNSLWVGGLFGKVAGKNARNAARIDLATGSVDPGFRPDPDRVVRALALSNGNLYVGGSFDLIGGVERTSLAKVDPATGVVDEAFDAQPVEGTWRDEVRDEVQALAATPNGDRIFAGGGFGQIGGSAGRSFLTALDPATGLAVGTNLSNVGGKALDLAVSEDGTAVYAALADGENNLKGWNISSGALLWPPIVTEGDVQAVDVFGGNVYFGFHESFRYETEEPIDDGFRILVADRLSGTVLFDAFAPQVNSFFGVWAIDAEPQGLVAGGEFTSFGGVPTRGVAMMPNSSTDSQPPTPPTGLVAGETTISSVNLTWNPSADNVGVDRYHVYRDDLLVGTPSSTGFVAGGLQPETTYEFVVRAVDAAGNLSSPSAPLEVVTPADTDDTPPSQPTGLSASEVTASSVRLTWNPSTDDVGVAGYRVLREGAVVSVGTATSFTDVGLAASTTYQYRVVAVDASDNASAPSAPKSVTTAADGSAPTRPARLKAAGVTAASVELTWDESTDDVGVVGYRVRRNGAVVATVSGSSATDLVLTPGTTYTYTVEAVDGAGNVSPRSAPISVTTAAGPGTVSIIEPTGTWRYRDDTDPPPAWKTRAYDDAGWSVGSAELGFGDGDEETVIEEGRIAAYFRSTVDVERAASVAGLRLSLVRDDGAVVYVNGTEVFRTNMPAGTITRTTLASRGVTGDSEDEVISAEIPATALVDGPNVIAVEVHQADPGSSDLSFSLAVDVQMKQAATPPPTPPPPPSGSGTFVDDDGSIFEADIEWLAAEGVTKGCNPPTNDRYCPDDPVTRGQMAAFLVRFLGLTDDGGGNSFVDDNGSIFETDIARLAAAGITKGCNPPTNDRYCPDDPVTRGQMAAFLVRALGLTDDGGGNSFVDDNGSVFEADIARLAAAGITKGCNPPVNDRFCPNDTVTRAQMAAFLHRADPYR